jgi:hypothetical protein
LTDTTMTTSKKLKTPIFQNNDYPPKPSIPPANHKSTPFVAAICMSTVVICLPNAGHRTNFKPVQTILITI